MKIKSLSIIAAVALALVYIACQSRINYKMKVNLIRLTKDNIYDKKLVGDAIFDAHELQIDSLKKKSNKLFMAGVNLYKNKKDPAGAIPMLKQSLLEFPTVETYYEIGIALMDEQATKTGSERSQDLREALQALQVAEYLHYQPLSNVYYNMACADNLLANDSIHPIDKPGVNYNNQAVFDLRNAYMNGFSDSAMLKSDSRLKSVLKTDSYKQMIAELNAQKRTDKAQTVFDMFKAQFKPLRQPFVIPLDSVSMPNYKNFISFDFARFIPEMENTEFGRDVSHDYYAVGKLAETPLYTAIIYTSTEFYEIGDLEPVYTKLVTYNTQGFVIDSRIISCMPSPEKIKAVSIENNLITTQEYKVTWKYSIEQDLDRMGNGDTNRNVILKKEPTVKESFILTDIGKIVPASDNKVSMR